MELCKSNPSIFKDMKKCYAQVTYCQNSSAGDFHGIEVSLSLKFKYTLASSRYLPYVSSPNIQDDWLVVKL